MLKSPEEYLSSLEFDADPGREKDRPLNAEEWAFVEKYMGLDALHNLTEAEPETVPLLQAVPDSEDARPVLLAEKEIIVAPEPPAEPEPLLEIREVVHIPPQALPVLLEDAPKPILIVGESAPEAAFPPEEDRVEMEVSAVGEAPPENAEAVETTVAEQTPAGVAEAPPAKDMVGEEAVAQEIAVDESAVETIETVETPAETATETAVVEPARVVETATQTAVATKADPVSTLLKAEAQLKEKLKLESEVQMVSFFVGGQLFLLPVAGIQEVLRHMELVKVPQAPGFVAGVINLRGRVTPVVHLSALVTNAGIPAYSEKNFIIITGTESLQLGLIIDKVSSMHMVPQSKIIWNAESKLAEAAEFLSAIVDLDDRVCGVVSPEMITRLILPEA